MSFYDKYFIKKKYQVNVISLNNPTELFKTLEKENLEPELVEAIDGSTIDYQTRLENTSLFFSWLGPNNAIAIALSHMKAWEKILKSKENYGIVFEDDVILVPDFHKKFMEAFRNVPKNYDIFYLGCFGCQSNYNFLSLLFFSCNMAKLDFKKVNQFINKPNVSMGLHAYVISKKGIKKILDKIKGKIYFHLDYCIQQMIKKKEIIVYSPVNRLAFQTSTDRCISSNIKNSHPTLLNNLLSNFYIDQNCRASYFTTVSMYSLGDFNLTNSTILLIIFGSYLGYKDLTIEQATYIYLILSILDIGIFDIKNFKLNIKTLTIHYFFYIVPFMVSKNKKN